MARSIALDVVARALVRELGDVALDPRQMRPTELARLLNSTPLGEVINERQLHRHRTRAGFRIGDGRTVDLFRYVAWLAELRHAKPADPAAGGDYEAMKERARARNAAASASGRDIGPLPPVANPQRKAAALGSFRLFCELYFPNTFALAWSPDHLRVIDRIEQAVLHGGLFALAMPRGSGKSTLAECACLWAILIGAREFVCLIGSDESHAIQMLDSIKTELESNELLLEDFPEVVYPIHCLQGIANRCAGQLYQGQRTHIGWTEREIVLPTMPDSPASGAIVKVAGITGRIRGMKYKRPDGKSVRPSLVILDDPQTDESARSVSQCATREGILAGAVLGLAGPGKKISGIMPCTVIRPGDMADRILDRNKHPQWQGERTKMLYSFPTNKKLWEQYAEIRADSLRAGNGGREATEFYRKNRKAMDAGATVAWPERHNYDELSAVQHAMNLWLQDEAAFFAEYQNEPLDQNTDDAEMLSVDEITAKINGYEHGVVPLTCDHITMFIDVQKALLWYCVVAWEANFTGYVLDYGAFPKQDRAYYTLRDARPTLQQAIKGAGLEGLIYGGLQRLTEELLNREWQRDDGAAMRIERCLIDANWGESTDVVYQFCRQSSHASIVLPSHGKFVGASSLPFAEYKRKRGDRLGHNWRVPSVTGKRAVRHVIYDTNYWKSFVHARLAVAMGDPGCLSLFAAKPYAHRMFAEHLTAEFPVRTEGRGRTVDEWKIRPERPDNHLFDGLVGCAVAASMQGVQLLGVGEVKAERKKRPRIKLSDLRRSK